MAEESQWLLLPDPKYNQCWPSVSSATHTSPRAQIFPHAGLSIKIHRLFSDAQTTWLIPPQMLRFAFCRAADVVSLSWPILSPTQPYDISINKNCMYLRCTTGWCDPCICWGMITTVKFMNTSITSHSYHLSSLMLNAKMFSAILSVPPPPCPAHTSSLWTESFLWRTFRTWWALKWHWDSLILRWEGKERHLIHGLVDAWVNGFFNPSLSSLISSRSRRPDGMTLLTPPILMLCS